MAQFASITAVDRDGFWRDGYVIKRGYLLPEEIALVREMIEVDPAIHANVLKIADSEGGATSLALWNHPGDDVFGAIARSERVAGGAETLFAGEMYHYHSKLTMKMPGGGGRWEWHQDYGYWYNNGCLFPDLLSVAIAIDPATRANGCLQLLQGSHLMGRLEHGRVAGQTGADGEHLEEALRRLKQVHCEMEPGDALFFHCNTLHGSAPNRSTAPRRLLICCYNKATNDPFKAHHHPSYTPLAKVPDDAVIRAGNQVADVGARWFLEEGQDETSDVRSEP